MFIRDLGCGILLFAAALNTAVGAEFKGPLETPAKVNLQLAQSNRMAAVANTGVRLVAVGPRGHILLSENGGQDWSQVPVPVASDLVAVQFSSRTHGWAVGHDGVVLHTADGGKSWIKQLDGVQATALVDKYFKQRLAAGDEAIKVQQDYVTRFVEEGADKPFMDVLFINEKEGFVVGAFNMSFRTRDGGKTWEPLLWLVDNPSLNHLYALAAHAGEVYLAGERGLLLHWSREQERFVALASPYPGSFFGLLDTGKELVAYGLRGNVFVSSDGAKTWRKEATPAADSVVGATAIAHGRYVLVTRSGKILINKDQGSGFDVIKGRRPMSYSAVVASGEQTIVAVGSGGVRVESISGQSAQEK